MTAGYPVKPALPGEGMDGTKFIARQEAPTLVVGAFCRFGGLPTTTYSVVFAFPRSPPEGHEMTAAGKITAARITIGLAVIITEHSYEGVHSASKTKVKDAIQVRIATISPFRTPKGWYVFWTTAGHKIEAAPIQTFHVVDGKTADEKAAEETAYVDRQLARNARAADRQRAEDAAEQENARSADQLTESAPIDVEPASPYTEVQSVQVSDDMGRLADMVRTAGMPMLHVAPSGFLSGDGPAVVDMAEPEITDAEKIVSAVVGVAAVAAFVTNPHAPAILADAMTRIRALTSERFGTPPVLDAERFAAPLAERYGIATPATPWDTIRGLTMLEVHAPVTGTNVSMCGQTFVPDADVLNGDLTRVNCGPCWRELSRVLLGMLADEREAAPESERPPTPARLAKRKPSMRSRNR